MKKYIYGSLLSGTALVLGTPVHAQDTRIELGVGVDYVTGEFGLDQETKILEVPFTARLKSGPFSLRVRAPYVHLEGPGGVVPGDIDDSGRNRRGRGSDASGGDRVDDDNDDDDLVPGQTITTSASGLGDISLAASYSFDIGSNGYMDVIGRVSLPTGDSDKDLGIGETDYVAGAEIGHDGDGGGVYLYGGYKFRGGTGREDGVQGALGAYRTAGRNALLGAEVSMSEAAIIGVDDVITASVFGSYRVGDGLRLSGYVETGLSDNAPDIGTGVKMTWRTNFRRPFQRQ